MDKAAEKAMELLRQLAEKMGKTIEEIYPFFVKQVRLEAWAAILAWGAVTGLILLVGFLVRRQAKAPGSGEIPDAALGMALMLVALTAFLVAVAYNAPFLLNPHYAAIVKIMGLATGK